MIIFVYKIYFIKNGFDLIEENYRISRNRLTPTLSRK